MYNVAHSMTKVHNENYIENNPCQGPTQLIPNDNKQFITIITRGQIMIKKGMNRSPEPACNNTGHGRPVSPINAIGDLPSTPSISSSLDGSGEHFLHGYARD